MADPPLRIIKTVAQVSHVTGRFTGNPAKTSPGQLHLLLSDQTSPENHKIPASSQGVVKQMHTVGT